jgi:metallo-beta-lactamase family protein
MAEQKQHYAYLTFHGATGEVTGANFLLEIDGKKILVDCGLHQGTSAEEDKNWTTFAYDPKDIDFLFVTHAHSDHIGKIPKLVRDGFRGVIYGTEPTKEISQLMFKDAIGLLEEDAKDRGEKVLYEEKDIEQTMALWKPIPYHDKVVITPDLSVTLYDAGHVLGSAMYEFNYKGKKMLFTGDLGNTPTPLLRDTEVFEEPHFLLMESVYGDRNHEEQEDRRNHLARVIQDTVKNHGTLMIPSFSLERTQEILFELNDLIEHGRVPQVPIYLDSPLAIAITEVYRKHIDYLNKNARMLSRTDDIFDFPGLTVTRTRDESKAINHAPDPKVIIAGSGMMNGGRIVHHAHQHAGESRATLLLVGYQAVNTLGRQFQEGAKTVTINGDAIDVRCTVDTISGYSGHKGSDQLVGFVDSIKKNIEEVFCVMGETKSQMFLAQRLRDQVGVHAVAPQEGERVELFF